MQRRQFVQTVIGLSAVSLSSLGNRAFAHHGWSSFDETKPLYFAGKVKSIKWQNPHAEVVITIDKDLVIPADLSGRTPPAQSQKVDGAKVLKEVRLPKNRGDWVLELSPLTRIDAWKVAQPKAGDLVAAVGYTFADEKLHDGKHTARVEYFIVGEKMYGLRSMPA